MSAEQRAKYWHAEHAAANVEIARLERELAAARADAARYRELRTRLYGFDSDLCENGLGVIFKFPEHARIGVGDALDAAIDAALAKEPTDG